MVFNCNFMRVYEEKDKKVDENTITYFKFNYILSNIMVTTEVVYCLICMALFLLIIYWSTKKEVHVLGSDALYESASEEEEEVPKEERNYEEEKRRAFGLNFSDISLTSSKMNRSLTNSYDQRSQKESQIKNFKANYSQKSHQKHKITMDGIYKAPSLSFNMKKVGGHIQQDKRLKMRQKIKGISKRVDLFKEHKSYVKQRESGLNTQRENNRQDDLIEDDPMFFNNNQVLNHNSEEYKINNPPENDEYFTSGIYVSK